MADNPFATVGITPAVAKKLNDKQMETFLKHLKRGWNAVSHPDLGGNPETFQKMSAAFEELEDSAARRRHRLNYTKQGGPKKQVAELEKTVKELQRHLLAFSSRYLSFIQAAHGQTEEDTVFHYPNGVPVSDPRKRLDRGRVSRLFVIKAAESGGVIYTPFERRGDSKHPFRRSEEEPIQEPDRFLFGVILKKAAENLAGLEAYKKVLTPSRDQIKGGKTSGRHAQLTFTRKEMLGLMPYVVPEIVHGYLVSVNQEGTNFYIEGTVPETPDNLKFA